MISLEHPEIMTFLSEAGPGLWPFRTTSDGCFRLAVKSSADLILAAKVKKKLKFHLYQLAGNAGAGLGLITAVYDREDAPATISTLCSGGNMRLDILEFLSQSSLGIYFFDTHNSELFGGIWKLSCSSEMPDFISQCLNEIPPVNEAEYQVALRRRFSNPEDDGCVVEAVLVSSSQPEKITVLQVTDESVQSRRGEGFGLYQSQIEIDKAPGEFQEAEIARLLSRAYSQNQIFVNPSIGDGKEFCDVLCLGKHEAITVHAKSTQRLESRINETDDKRNSRLDKHFKKSLAQVKGAERALYKLQKAIWNEGERIDIEAKTILLIHVIIIWEKHPQLLIKWSDCVCKINNPYMPIVVLDFTEFTNMTSRYRTREALSTAFWSIWEDFRESRQIGEYLFFEDKIASFAQ